MFKRKIHESFDDFLKRNFQESQRKADMIPAVNTQENKFDFIKDLYYRMIKCGKYDSEVSSKRQLSC